MTPIQRESLPIALNGQDLCGQAQTGTGKTAAFLIGLFSQLDKEPPTGDGRPSALILAPTRELALQTYREARLIGKHTDLRIVAIYGGEGYASQQKRLANGVDVVTGTPGRILDFARKRVLDLSGIRFLVIDEADRLLDMGFYEELRDILRRLPRPNKRQSMLFSATLDFNTKRIASSSMNHPVDVAVRPEAIAADGIEEAIYHVEREQKFPLLLGLLAREDIPKGLIFTNTKIVAAWLVEKLRGHGYDTDLLTGDLRQTARNRVLEKFQQGRLALLVASDVASRGLHIDDVSHIFNFDVPQDPEDYVHRIGRTARAGKEGKAYTLACDEYCWSLPEIEKLMGRPLPYQSPYESDYREDKLPELTVGVIVRRQRKQSRERKDFQQKSGGSGRSSGPGRRGGSSRSGGRPRKPRR
jgi:ATP-dependent RNA helicase RhlB